MNNLVITSIAQFADLAKKNPDLININAFSPIKDVILKLVNTTGCKCKSGVNIAAYRQNFETAMIVLSPQEQTLMKTLLKADQICYYYKQIDGRLIQSCF